MCFFLNSTKSSIFGKGLSLSSEMAVKDQGQSPCNMKGPKREGVGELEEDSLERGWGTVCPRVKANPRLLHQEDEPCPGWDSWGLVLVPEGGRMSWSGILKLLLSPGAQFSHHERREFPEHLFQPLRQSMMILPPPTISQTWKLPCEGGKQAS